MQPIVAAPLRLSLVALVLMFACASPRVPAAPKSTPVVPRETRAQPEMTPATGSVADARGADPTVTDPDKYQSVMENERVRVLRYHDLPGAKTHQHHHPNAVLYALSGFRRQLTFPDGTTSQREFQPGDVMWIPAQTHVGENIGDTNTEVLMIEIKAP